MKQAVIIYKVLRYASNVKKQVWVNTNFGIIKKNVNQIPSIAMAAFLEREKNVVS